MSDQKYIRFSGYLYENMEFRFKPGWETKRVAHKPREAEKSLDGYEVSLLTEDEQIILSVYPDVHFDDSCDPSGNEIRYAEVVAYLPLHPQARIVTFSRGGFEIYRRPIAKRPPTVSITEFDYREGKVNLSWNAETQSDQPLTYNITYVVDKKRFFTLALNYKDDHASFDISKFPGSKRARVAVLASDGLRSGFDVSKSFKVDEKSKGVFILKPGPGETFSFGQDVTFCGRAHDIAGASLPEKYLVWKLNGQVILKGKHLGAIRQPEGGSYKLTLEAVKGNKVLAGREISFKVGKRSDKQKRYFDLLEKLEKDQ